MNKCIMCKEQFDPPEDCETDNICESCFHDDFESMDLEDKLEVLLK